MPPRKNSKRPAGGSLDKVGFEDIRIPRVTPEQTTRLSANEKSAVSMEVLGMNLLSEKS